MESESMVVISMEDVYDEAKEKFLAEFNFSNMDTMMHRFPPALRDEMYKQKYPYMVEPRFVAIGPYHHGKKHLEKMEEVKKAAACCLCYRIGVAPEEAMQKVLAVVDEARGKYYLDDKTGTMEDDTCFAEMMFRDACFLLLYMDVYHRSYGDMEDCVVNPSMRRFLYSNRDCIESDIMLLENQIPWQVIQALVVLAKEDISQAVGNFVKGMGNSFKITESCDDPSQEKEVFCSFFKKKRGSSDDPPAIYAESLNHENNPPHAHLLEALRCHKTKSKPVDILHLEKRILGASMSVLNLEEIGMKLKPTATATFSDMHLEYGLVSRRLTLAQLSLSDTRASCLVNMAALEACTQSRFGDHGHKNAVCSYLAFLAFLMVGTEDVRRLRSLGLLHGTLSDGDMLAFFNAVTKHLPSGRNFALVVGEIQTYAAISVRTILYKWVYNNYATAIKVVSLIATFIGLYKAISSVIHTN